MAADEGLAALARKFSGAGVPTRALAQEPSSLPPTPAVQASAPVASAPPLEPTERMARRVSMPAPSPTPSPMTLASGDRTPVLSPGTQAIYDELQGRGKGAVTKIERLPAKATPAAVPENPSPDIKPAPKAEAPKWEPSKYDDKYARKLGKTPAQYHEMMNGRLARAHETISNPNAPMRARAEAAWTLRSTNNIPDKGAAADVAEAAE